MNIETYLTIQNKSLCGLLAAGNLCGMVEDLDKSSGKDDIPCLQPLYYEYIPELKSCSTREWNSYMHFAHSSITTSTANVMFIVTF